MARVISCSSCGSPLNIRDEMMGRKVMCPSCHFTFIADGTQAGAERSPEAEAPAAVKDRPVGMPNSARQPEPRLKFGVHIKFDEARELKGAYEGTVGPDGLTLRRSIKQKKKEEGVLIPVGAPAEYRGGNRVAVTLAEGRVEFAVDGVNIYPRLLARDLASFLNQEVPVLSHEAYTLPVVLKALTTIPLVIGIVGGITGGLIGGALGAILGVGMMVINLSIVRQATWPVGLRVALCVVLNVVFAVAVIAAVIGVVVLLRPPGRS